MICKRGHDVGETRPRKKSNVIKSICMFVLLAATLGGCSGASLPQAERAEAIHDCAVAALTPYVGDLAQDILAAVLAGGNLKTIFNLHGIRDEDGMKIVQALNACIAGDSPEPPLAAPVQS